MSFALLGEALCQFRGRPPRRIWLWPPVALTVLFFAVFIDQPQPRLALGPVIFSAQALGLLALLPLWSRRGWPRGAVLVGLGLAAILPVLLMRTVLALMGALHLAHLHTPGPAQALGFLVVVASTVVTTFGFFLMNKERSDAQSRHLAMYDELTGLPNRRQSLLALARQVALARRTGQPLALLMLDIDHFKRVNDAHGHLAGDAALRHVAQTMASRLRRQDTPGRFGGEEFLCVLPATSGEGARQLADAMREAVAQQPFVFGGGRTLLLTVSVGVSELPPGSMRSIEALISAADAALYRAKDGGRNGVVLAGEADYPTGTAAPALAS
jgi:diguanylate cyclase (GGDEF)-like protein